MSPLNRDGYSASFWELDPSTRQSLHLFTKWSPVDVTLATAGTAENLITASTETPTVNLATNPSFETADPPTGYTAAGSSISRVGSGTITASSGSYSIEADPDNSAASEGFYYTTVQLGSNRDQPVNLVVSAYFADTGASGDDARIEIRDSTGATTHATGNTITLSTTFTRSTAFFNLSQLASAAYRIYFVTVTQHNTNFYVDDFQVELRKDDIATTYCDGAQGLYYEWDGTAHASTSRRRIGLVSIRGYNLYTTRNVFIAFDHTASSSLGELKLAGTDFWMDHPFDAGNISMINDLSGEQPRVFGGIWGTHELRRP